MNKVVYNSCYGGFGISTAAAKQLKELGAGDLLSEVFISADEQLYYWVGTRHDHRLVQTVERLGDKASSGYAKLRIAEIAGNVYRIDEYDGYESVIEPANQEWIAIQH
jgi:hypothetical protein